MDKPDTMSTNEWMIKNVSQELGVPLHIVKAVITEQFRSMKESVHDNNSLEISGLGKYVFDKRKAKHRVDKLNHVIKNHEKSLLKVMQQGVRTLIEEKIINVQEKVKYLKRKINDHDKNDTR